MQVSGAMCVNGVWPASPEEELDDGGVHAVRRWLAEVGAEAGPEIAAHLTRGKLLRARIVLLVCRLGTPADPARAIGLAAAIELLHAGGLCHDDVVDGSLVRRSRPTIEATHGTQTAVLAGLFLMLRGLAGLAREPEPLRRVVARALRDVARGQTDEGLDLFEPDLSPEAYLRRAEAKTGALYELAGRLGAAAGGLSVRSLDAAASYAASFGVAFQLADDLRDFLGGPALGREAGTDLRQGVYTLPVLLTLSGRRPGAEVLRRLLAQGDRSLASCVALLRANGALAETERLAAEHMERAIAALAVFPASAVRRRLEALARSVLDTANAREEAALQPVMAGGRTALRPLPARYLFAMEGGLSARMAFAAERFRVGLPVMRPGMQGWVDSAATATALGVMLLWLAGATVDARPAANVGSRARNATLVGAVDLAIADLAALLADVPAAAARALTGSLCRRLAHAVVVASADRTSSLRLDDDAMQGLADEVASAAVRCLAGEAQIEG